MIILDIFLVIFFIAMNAFFVIAEFALVKVRKTQIDVLASSGSIGAKYAQKVVNDLNSYLSACQLGITIASLALGWIGEPVVSALIGPLLSYFGLDEGHDPHRLHRCGFPDNHDPSHRAGRARPQVTGDTGCSEVFHRNGDASGLFLQVDLSDHVAVQPCHERFAQAHGPLDGRGARIGPLG